MSKMKTFLLGSTASIDDSNWVASMGDYKNGFPFWIKWVLASLIMK